jgi:uncharacterized repeat protein (TIGR02543 family)
MKHANRWLAVLVAACLVASGGTAVRASVAAQPRAQMQKLVFDPNGGSCDTAWDYYTVGQPYSPLPAAVWDGYAFTGWFTAAEGGTQLSAGVAVTADAERTVYAHWKPSDVVNGILWTYTVADGAASVGSGFYAGDRAVPASTGGTVTVPSMLGGCPVKHIADYAFYGCTGVTSVKIPSGVESIGRYAFSGCLKLVRVAIPSSVKEVGPYAFNACPVLEAATLPAKPETVAEGVFANCDRLETVKLPSGAREIGEAAFYRCGALREVAFPAGVTNIGRYAFFECGALKAAELPDGVRVVPASAFEGCGSLADVRLPAGLTTIGSRAFRECAGLAALEIPSGVTVLGERALEGCRSLASARVPDGVRSIRPWTFGGCHALREVDLPMGLERVGEGAFAQCIRLEAVALPDSVAVMGREVFRDCTALADVTLPRGLVEVPDYAFAGCRALSSITVPASVAYLGKGIGEWLRDVYFPGNAPGHDAEAYSPREVAVTSHAAGGTRGWDGNASSRELPERWLGWPIAAWTPGPYAIRFMPNGGEGTMEDQPFAYGSPVTLRGNAFRRPKWVFAGWAVEPGGQAVHADGEKVEFADVVDATVVLYAVWEREVLPEIGGDAEIAGELAGAADGRLERNILTADGYADFRSWALGVKGRDGKPAGAEGVLASGHAWASYVLGAETLFENEPVIRIEEIEVDSADGVRKSGGTVTVRVTVRDGAAMAAVDAAKVAGLFAGSGDLHDWTGAGRLAVSVSAKGLEGDGLVFEVNPGDGGAPRVFLRIAE